MITNHQFVGKREWGMFPTADKPCQYRATGSQSAAVCGMPKGQHATPCPAALNIKGEHFPCDMSAPHDGWGHANKAAQAIWGGPATSTPVEVSAR